MRRCFLKVILIGMAALQGASTARAREFDAWFVDSLVKVFPSDPPGAQRLKRPEYWAARNQHLSIQLAVRSKASRAQLQARVETLEGPHGAKIPEVQVRHVGYVVVASPTPDSPADELVGEAPGWYPDPLLDLPFDLEAGRTHSLWITVHVPVDAAPGAYQGVIEITAGAHRLVRSQFSLRVVSARVPEERSLKVTNWLQFNDKVARQFYGVSAASPEGWKLLENLARVMAEHRQNVVLTPLLDLVEPRTGQNGTHYDFSQFDRWVETFRKAGAIGYIEGGHLIGRTGGGYDSPLEVPILEVVGGEVRRVALPPEDPRVGEFLAGFLSALNSHLEQKGWKNIYYQHILDEAHGTEPAVYERIAKIVRHHLPGIPIMDAVDADHMPEELQNNCDVWVPQLGLFDDQMDLLERRMKAGREVWFYTCLYPQRRYLNRLLDYSLLKVRLLHWLNFRYNFAGYLHWGWNWWTPEPMLATQPVINDNQTLLPAGDAFIVYPDRANLSVHSSIRFEAMCDGIEDFELLRLLKAKKPAEAERIAKDAISSFTEYVRDPVKFREIERRLLKELSE
ncbi:MAG TPA: glycoside hydrolase domain-containing protein [Terriglobia bacterium]|nr:glycoside hydrolase domain-containing protein [Terriglobia bacterium]